ncbi:MAG: hypothetical protein WBQ89_10255 [Candidatus Acidiferrum sp.]
MKISLVVGVFIVSMASAPTAFAQHKAWKEQKEKLVPQQQCRRVDKEAALDADESLVGDGNGYKACKVIMVKPGDVVINDPQPAEKTNSNKP